MKRLNNILHYRLLIAIASIIICGALSPTFAQKSNAVDLISAQNERDAKYDLLTLNFPFAAAAFPKQYFREYPKPDFSGIEKWYEVIRYEYGDFEGGKNELNFWLKMKNDARPDFTVAYYDKDSILIGGARWACFCEGSCYVNAPIGTVQKWNAGAPAETQMKNVTTVKVVRNEN